MDTTEGLGEERTAGILGAWDSRESWHGPGRRRFFSWRVALGRMPRAWRPSALPYLRSSAPRCPHSTGATEVPSSSWKCILIREPGTWRYSYSPVTPLAFQGVVIPGRYVPLLHPWLVPMSVKLPSDIRMDMRLQPGPSVAPGVSPDCRLWCLGDPLGPLEDPFTSASRQLGQPFEKHSWLCAQGGGHGPAIRTDLPVDELFWDLSWSFEGKADTALYTFPKVHAGVHPRVWIGQEVLFPGRSLR